MDAAKRSGSRWWATVCIGVVACLGCCAAVPLLASIGLAGSGILAVGSGWLELVGVSLIAIGLIGVVVSRRRADRSRGTCRADRDHDESCGCAATPGATVLSNPTNPAER